MVAVAGLFLAFGQQLLTGDEGRARLTSLTATVALVVVEVLGGELAIRRLPSPTEAGS